MFIINDNYCGWIKNLSKRNNIKVIDKNHKCDWIIIGAGFTGLSAARKLGNLNPNKKIILVDAQLAGEGASSRNSGYLVDTTLNDGFSSNIKIKDYQKKVDIYERGIVSVKNFIKDYLVECDWNECGKYFASSKLKDEKKLKKFSEALSNLNIHNQMFFKKDLFQKLGTEFYNVSIFTKGGILLHPGKLARAMTDTLPENVELYENSQLIKWKKINYQIQCIFKKNEVIAQKIIFCTNGFLKSLGIKSDYNFPLTLTASMTRPLTNKEFKSINEPNEWGVLPVRPMGATIRMTKDRRILIRNTAEKRNPNYFNKLELAKKKIIHQKGIQKRFPSLDKDIIDSTWSGVVSRSGNGSQIFEKIDDSIFAAGCYNGSGIGVGTLFGEQIALKANNQNTDEINIIEKLKKPNWLPPQPILSLGIKIKLFYERLRAKSEI